MARSYRSTVRRPGRRPPVQAGTSTARRRPGHRLGHPERLGQAVVAAVARADGGQELLHGLGHDLEDGRGVALDLLGRVGVLGLQVLEQAHHGRRAEGVVLHDGLVGNADEGQDQRRQHPGPVLAGAAVEDGGQRAGRCPRTSKAAVSAGAPSGHHLRVAGGHIGGLPPRRQLLGGREHVGQRQVDVAHRHLVDREPAPLLGLVHRAQVDDRGHARDRSAARWSASLSRWRPSARNRRRQPIWWPSPGPVAAQVTEVDAAVEGEGAGGPGVGRRRAATGRHRWRTWPRSVPSAPAAGPGGRRRWRFSRRRPRRPVCGPCGW